MVCSIPDCESSRYRRDWCRKHYDRWLKNGDPLLLSKTPSGGKRREKGEGCINLYGYIQTRVGGVTRLEHRVIMEAHLGRPLLPEENIHHINGDRTDNRIENLELWNTRQPKGQRVDEKVVWAREILGLYGSDDELRRYGGTE